MIKSGKYRCDAVLVPEICLSKKDLIIKSKLITHRNLGRVLTSVIYLAKLDNILE